MKVPSPETYTLTKTVPFHQSKEVSKFIWRLHQECRWYFDNRNLTKFDLYGTVAILRNNTGWNAAYSEMQRASIDDGRKAVRLHQSTIDRKNRIAKRKQKEGKKARTIQYEVAQTVLSKETFRQAASIAVVPETEDKERHYEIW